MPKLITFSYFMLFWVFYEVSGGSDFAPRERVILSQAPFVQSAPHRDSRIRPSPVPVVTTASFSPVETHSLPSAMPVALAIAAPAMSAPLTKPVATDATAAPSTPDVVVVYVEGTRVNFRAGPGTDHKVLDVLVQGTPAELVAVNGDGWAQIRLPGDGKIGWMAERLLSDG